MHHIADVVGLWRVVPIRADENPEPLVDPDGDTLHDVRRDAVAQIAMQRNALPDGHASIDEGRVESSGSVGLTSCEPTNESPDDLGRQLDPVAVAEPGSARWPLPWFGPADVEPESGDDRPSGVGGLHLGQQPADLASGANHVVRPLQTNIVDACGKARIGRRHGQRNRDSTECLAVERGRHQHREQQVGANRSFPGSIAATPPRSLGLGQQHRTTFTRPCSRREIGIGGAGFGHPVDRSDLEVGKL